MSLRELSAADIQQQVAEVSTVLQEALKCTRGEKQSRIPLRLKMLPPDCRLVDYK